LFEFWCPLATIYFDRITTKQIVGWKTIVSNVNIEVLNYTCS